MPGPKARKAPTPPDADAVRRVIERELRPAFLEDGGNVTFDTLDGWVVRIRMGGQCSVCPSAPRTAKHFIEARLREVFGERITVEARLDPPYFWR